METFFSFDFFVNGICPFYLIGIPGFFIWLYLYFKVHKKADEDSNFTYESISPFKKILICICYILGIGSTIIDVFTVLYLLGCGIYPMFGTPAAKYEVVKNPHVYPIGMQEQTEIDSLNYEVNTDTIDYDNWVDMSKIN